MGCEVRERRLLRCWGCAGLGQDRAAAGSRCSRGSSRQQRVDLPGTDGGASVAQLGETGRHMEGHWPCQPHTEWLGTHHP